MKNFYKILCIVLVLVGLPLFASAQITVPQGGTGSTTLSGILLGVPGNLRVQTLKIGNCLQLGSGVLSLNCVIASSTLLGDTNTFSGPDFFTNSSGNFAGTWQSHNAGDFLSSNAGNWAGTWQTFSPSHFLTSLAGAASSTLLGDTNTWSGNDKFSNLVTGSVSGNAGTATKLAAAVLINGVSFDGSGNITVKAASSSALGDTNTWSGQNTFTAQTNFSAKVDIGSSTPFANLSIHANNGDTNKVLFAIGSSTQSATTTLFSVSNKGQVVIGNGYAEPSRGLTVGDGSTLAFMSVNGGYSGTGNGAAFSFDNAGGSTGFYTGAFGNPSAIFGNTDYNVGIVGNQAPIEFYTDGYGTKAMVLTAGSYLSSTFGNLGLGEASPAARLTVKGDGTTQNLQIKTSGNVQSFTVLNSGNVGVGSTNPAVLFDVQSASASSTLRLYSGGTNLGGQMIIKDTYGTGYTCIYTKAGTVFSKVAASATAC